MKWSQGHNGSQVGAGPQAWFLICEVSQVGLKHSSDFPQGGTEYYSKGRTVKSV